MDTNSNLSKLIDDAAAEINILNISEISEVEALQKTIKQISKELNNTNDIPAELLSKAKTNSYASLDLIELILENKVKDGNKAIESVSKAIMSLQEIADQIGVTPRNDIAETQVAQQEESIQHADQPKEEVQEPQNIIPEGDVSLVLDFVTESREHIESSESALLELENDPENSENINMIFRGFHTIKGMAGFLNLKEIGSLAHSAENLLDLARKNELKLEGANIDAVFGAMDMIKNMITHLQESIENNVAVPKQEKLEQMLSTLKSRVEQKGNQPQAVKEDVVVKTSPVEIEETQESKDESTNDNVIEEKLADGERRTAERRTGDRRSGTTIDEKIKVSTSRLDNLINMVGELVIAQLMVAEETKNNLSSVPEMGRKIAHQGKIVRELQELSMSMRMIPIAGVFQKMSRLARDLSRQAGKDIRFVTTGEETELDRSIVDKISDPLVHMVRNCVDHAIEPADERIKTGKDKQGTIELRAFHQAGNIVIEIEDDGKGLDKERIYQKAIENGIIEKGQELTDEEIYKLIFYAGLSTAQKITSISGRGVGMDVVRKNIEALRGKIEISTIKGKGTTFTIRMPLTLAIIEGQIVKVGSQRYIIPINLIVQSLRPRQEQLSSIQGKGEMLMERGHLIPIVRMHKLFNVQAKTEDPTQSLLVIVEEDSKQCCLLVDELLGQQQIVIKSLGDELGEIKGISGGAIMGDGKISLILDIPGLIELSQN
ncbi:MAG TPA: chemotaxis protein CheA [Sedimentisphaerales bacterium]|nr:chemotaxis protein CheA [Sedimentisphaerales bacterium]